MILSLRTNVYMWKSPLNRYIDNKLNSIGIKLINLPWDKFELIKSDQDHFTWRGYKSFCKNFNVQLAHFFKTGTKIHIIADSTIDYWNYTSNFKYTGKANKFLKLYCKDYKITIDAIAGSGYTTRNNFIDRIDNSIECDAVILIGGWNDVSYSSIHSSMKKLKELQI